MDDLPDRFWDKVQAEPNTGCWLWDAAVTTDGYGQFWVGKQNCLAHRVSYEALVGSIPDGLHIDHLCRVRSCVNPEHMEAVTCAENLCRGNGSASKTHCPKGHPYNGENLYIRPDNSGRECRICRQAAHEKYRKLAQDAALKEKEGND